MPIRPLLLLLMLITVAVPGLRSPPATRGAASNWRDETERTGAGEVGARTQFGMAAAPDGTMYVLGGHADESGAAALADLWSLKPGGRWRRFETSGDGPPPLIEPHLAVDRLGRLYEFGGIVDDGSPVDHLYRLESAEGQWTDLTDSIVGPRPPARQDHGFAYDPIGDQLYVFGGDAGDGHQLNDFWRYDVATNRWTDMTEASGAEEILPRELYNVTYDGHGHLYLFGGTIDGGDSYARRLNDFWRYDIDAGRWRDLTLSSGSARVPGRHYYGQAADADGNFYVIGGYITPESNEEAAESSSDFWAYVAATNSWVNLTPLAAPLLPRTPYNAVRDPSDGSLALFGGARVDGDGGGGSPSDFWRWDPEVPTGFVAPESARIGGEGGELQMLGGAVALQIPAGALARPAQIALAPSSVRSIADDQPAGGAVEVQLGASLARRGTLSIRLDLIGRGQVPQPVDVYLRVPGGWTPVPAPRVQSDGRTLAVRIASSGTYAIVSQARYRLHLPILSAAGTTKAGLSASPASQRVFGRELSAGSRSPSRPSRRSSRPPAPAGSAGSGG
jgi:hypothetical protein